MKLNFIRKNKSLFIESFLVLLLTLLVTAFIYILSINFKLFNVLKTSYKKIDLTDIYYAELKTKDVGISNDIALVNIAYHSRAEIAQILTIVNEQNPKVIGLDVVFKTTNYTAQDSLLLKALNNTGDKLVAAYDLFNTDENTNSFFNLDNKTKGFVNIIGNNKEFGVIKKAEIKYKKDASSDIAFSFAYELVKKYDSELTSTVDDDKIDIDNRKPYIINYTGGYDRFLPIEGIDILEKNRIVELLKNKIVIIGFFGSHFTNSYELEDRKYTPMNSEGGHGTPDMNGALIHANIAQMMIDDTYINYWPKGKFFIGLFSLLLAYPFIVMFTYFFVQSHIWYHVAAKITQLVLAIFLIFLVLNLYEYANFKFELKFFLLILAISVDALYLYQAMAAFIYTRYGKKSYFIQGH